MTKLMIHNSINIKQFSTRTMASTAAIKRWKIWLREAVQDFIQCAEMTLYVVLRPAP